MLEALSSLCNVLLDSLPYAHVGLVLENPELDRGLQMCLIRAEQKGRITSLDLLARLCLVQPRMPLDFFAARAHCWLMFNFLSTGSPAPPLQSCFPASGPPACTVIEGYSLPATDFAFVFTEFYEGSATLCLQAVAISLKSLTTPS